LIHISQQKKDQVYQEARRLLIKMYGNDKADGGSCLYWSKIAINLLASMGLRAILQAGDLQWQMVPHELDDGVSSTHFSYMWSDKRDMIFNPSGELPEIHVWVGLPEQNEIVDFSTGGFKKRAIEHHGLPWLGPDPPLYLWGPPPDRTIYHPFLEATLFAKKLIDYHC
jgi:hypothetical protein